MTYPPRKRIYPKPIELGPQPHTWIAKHKGFASREWAESQVQYGEWVPEKTGQCKFLIYTTVFDGIKPLTILIKVKEFDTCALVYHIHVLRKK